jgi:hypothetical protein
MNCAPGNTRHCGGLPVPGHDPHIPADKVFTTWNRLFSADAGLKLDASNKTLSVKGALQAALDDDNVSINAGFRHAFRRFSAAETGSMNPAFPEALAGPVAYGLHPRHGAGRQRQRPL